MRPNLFNSGQRVLLVGEGNFSFSVSLLHLDLDLKLTSSCFESSPAFSLAEENIRILEQRGVRVLLGVDATCLTEREDLRGEVFECIVFNFPHVGGKSKIHLNRELLRRFFISCSPLLASGGSVVVSLCRGQGGSYLDKPKLPADTWKAVEMAAHACFVLTAVEPWDSASVLGNYTCVGRRSRDVSFRREGALVHVFRRAPVSPPLISTLDQHLRAFVPHYVETPDGHVCCDRLEAMLLERDLFKNKSSAPTVLLNKLKVFLSQKGRCVKMHRVHSVTSANSLCRNLVDEESFSLRVKCPEDVSVIQLFWGTVFANLVQDFAVAPASCHVFVEGADASSLCEMWVEELGVDVCADVLKKSRRHACYIFLDRVAEKLLHLTGWRELWAAGSRLEVDENGTFMWQPSVVSPPIFTFDLCVGGARPPDERAVSHVLWQLAGEFIENVEVIDTFSSPEGWHSKCLRLKYRSFETALYRSLVVNFQLHVISPVLAARLGIDVR